ncbi:palmitoyltransferase swf1 [Orbilia oligospora]|uniref:Palmitoyltransferase n=1 Tax=Orbilia oligospora TaxID=2813651 RepID=A0A7C8PZE9_ORBOL|nr:palmitoyltransferase swf1 [Orbilia oligospora]
MDLDPGLRDILVAILSLSFVVFVALFGHVPALRKTPIGWGHHFIWKTLPRWFTTVDMKLTGGMMVRTVKGLFNYIMYDKHPLIQLFYLGLVSGGLYLFWLGAWDRIWSPFHKIMVPVVASLPYITLYLASYTDPGYILPENHRGAMKLYPFDYINFKPGYHCSTCRFEKPARSKHCPICKHCIAKQDHHCVWINNCVGHKNVKYFFAFLMSTNIILFYGFYLTSIMIHQLVSLTFVLVSYLLWAGTTTNETFKWSDWKEDIAADEVWMARDPARNPFTGRWPSSGPLNAYNWPVQTDKLVYRIVNPEEMEYLDKHLVWNKVESIHELENIYDVGFWKTLESVVWDLKF